MNYPEFAPSPVPMSVAEKVLKMSSKTIRRYMEKGVIDIGFITNASDKYRNTYISPKKFWELTGYVWKGESDEQSD